MLEANSFYNCSIDTWCETLFQSADNPDGFVGVLPFFPDVQTQIGMVGSSGRHALIEMSYFYRELHTVAQNANFLFTENTRVLDFGCGFGRLTRFFLRDTKPNNIFGVDCTKSFIDICKNTFPVGTVPPDNFILNDPFQPLSLPSASFDIITASSVFTHLSEHAANKWVEEFRRLLKPGGLFIFTLRQRRYLEYCATLTSTSGYQQVEKEAFGNFLSRIEQYVRGEYMYYPSGGGELLSSDFYGDTVVPAAYVRNRWCDKFSLLEMFDDLERYSQAFVALQAK